MQDFELIFKIKSKDNKSDTEKLLLHYDSMLSNICEELVDVSKCHIHCDRAIDNISKHMSKINIPLDRL